MRKVIKNFQVDYVQVMKEDGTVDKDDMPDLSKKEIKELHKTMVLVRTFDNRAFSLQRQGRIGSYLQVKGQEAAQVGGVWPLRDKDFMFPMYRSCGALIARKYPLHQLYQYWGGDERGSQAPKDVNNFPMAIPVGTQIAHASGAGMAARLQDKDDVALVFFGDGASSKSEFHTGLNFAGTYNANAIFICENNGYAISTPRDEQTKATTIAQRAIAYGISGVQVDGNDIFAMVKVTKEAVDRARKGDGPTLIEAVTYRMGDHSTSDDAKRYRDDKEVKMWENRDPILRIERYMKNEDIMDDKEIKKVYDDCTETVNAAVKKYESIEPADKKDIFAYIYEEMTPRLKKQYDEMRGE